MRLTIELYGVTYSITDKRDDQTAQDLKEMFSRLLVVAGFPPSVIDMEDGYYEFKENE